jgi:hypothetical protein
MTAVTALERELDAWQARGWRATFWLRDDDACRDTPALRRLLALARARAVPVAVAAIPAAIDATLGGVLAASDEATLVQHGYAHRNHASANERSAELGDGRDAAECRDELCRGRARLRSEFGDRFLPILVPPWNRIGDALLPSLASAGFAGVSRFGPRRAVEAAPGLREVNTHVDPIAWRRDRAFIGAEAAFARVVAHLAARRENGCDADEPTGLLTHHLAFDDGAWDFVDELLARTRRHPAVAWLDVGDAFAVPETTAICVRSA